MGVVWGEKEQRNDVQQIVGKQTGEFLLKIFVLEPRFYRVGPSEAVVVAFPADQGGTRFAVLASRKLPSVSFCII